MRTLNVLQSFSDFSWDDLEMSDQQFDNYKSKYLDLYDKVKSDNQKETVSVLDEVDFELELIHRDEINVAYILNLLADLLDAGSKDKIKKQIQIVELLAGQSQLRSKKELIEKFINENMPKIKDSKDIVDQFDHFWNDEKRSAFNSLCQEEGLIPNNVDSILSDYMFSGKQPLRDTIINSLVDKPKIRERKSIGERILNKMLDFVDTFINGIPSTQTKVYDLPDENYGLAAEDDAFYK